jgi:uncharacterized protein involved in cysteine biosynthesis
MFASFARTAWLIFQPGYAGIVPRWALQSEIPLLDLIAPLFGTALMVHLFHRILRQETA